MTQSLYDQAVIGHTRNVPIIKVLRALALADAIAHIVCSPWYERHYWPLYPKPITL